MSAEAVAVRLAGLRYAWRRGPVLLDIAGFELARGERVLLRGASGSGKSTLLGLIGGVLVPQSGSVAVLGTDLASLAPSARDAFRADHIGVVFQQFNLLPFLDVLDNVVLACRFSARRRARAGDGNAEALRLLGALGLGPEFARRPVRELSVGQQQRVAAARALIGAPELVLADEPTSALDADARADFLALLFAECERAGAALLFVSHDASLSPMFARALALSELNSAAPRRSAA